MDRNEKRLRDSQSNGDGWGRRFVPLTFDDANVRYPNVLAPH
jgi:hypothetical protein